jgi:hypothetical protein
MVEISYLLRDEEVLPYLDVTEVVRTVSMNFNGSDLAGRYLIVTGPGRRKGVPGREITRFVLLTYPKNLRTFPKNDSLCSLLPNGRIASPKHDFRSQRHH